MKKWSFIALCMSLVLLAFAGSALAAKPGKTPPKPTPKPKTITVRSIEKGTDVGVIYVTTDTATTVQALQNGITVPGKSISWKAAPGHKDGKTFTAAFKAALQTDYPFKVSAPFALAKDVTGSIRWNSIPVAIQTISYGIEPGQFSFTLLKPAKLADLQGKITAFAGGTKLAVQISGSGASYDAAIVGAKAGVAYKLVFSEPFLPAFINFTWQKKPEPPSRKELPPVEGDVPSEVYTP